MISGIFTAILLLAFVGIWIWAWSKQRKDDFAKSARLPLEDDTFPTEEHKA